MEHARLIRISSLALSTMRHKRPLLMTQSYRLGIIRTGGMKKGGASKPSARRYPFSDRRGNSTRRLWTGLRVHCHTHAGNRYEDVVVIAVYGNGVSPRTGGNETQRQVRLGVHDAYARGSEVVAVVPRVIPDFVAANGRVSNSLAVPQGKSRSPVDYLSARRHHVLVRAQG